MSDESIRHAKLKEDYAALLREKVELVGKVDDLENIANRHRLLTSAMEEIIRAMKQTDANTFSTVLEIAEEALSADAFFLE